VFVRQSLGDMRQHDEHQASRRDRLLQRHSNR
jgi:hypothetical protein